jgi:excisionase family DNA binding protein
LFFHPESVPSMSELERLSYSVAEAANLLGLHINTIKRAIAQGRISSAKMGAVHRIPAREVRRVAESGFELESQPPAKPKQRDGRGRPRKAG